MYIVARVGSGQFEIRMSSLLEKAHSMYDKELAEMKALPVPAEDSEDCVPETLLMIEGSLETSILVDDYGACYFEKGSKSKVLLQDDFLFDVEANG